MFIVFEGADGCGKSTQMELCQVWLQRRNIQCVCCRDPGSTELGNQVRSILLDHGDTAIGNRAEMLLFMVARAQMVEEVIRPALDRNQVVLCDRFLLSTVVYQGYANENSATRIPVDEIYAVGTVATDRVLPDLTLVFDLSSVAAQQRLGPVKDRMESRGGEYFERVRQGFLAEAKRNPESIHVIDASFPIDQVHEQVKQVVEAFVS